MLRITGPLIALCIALAMPTPAEAEESSCQPIPELREALAGLDPQSVGNCTQDDPCWLALIDRARTLAEDHPQDLHTHRTYQNLVQWWSGDDHEERVEEMLAPYEERAESSPGDPMALYLAARFYDSLEEGIENGRRLVEMAPDYPWGHLALAAVLRSDGRQEGKPEARAEADDHLATFIRLCPSRFQEPLSSYMRGGDRDLLQPHIVRYREALAGAPVVTRLGYLPSLWRQEFKASPPNRHDEVRDRVRQDLHSIAALDRKENVRWWEAQVEGYEMTGDQAAVDRLAAEFAAVFPCHWRAVKARHESMNKSAAGQTSAEHLSQKELREHFATSDEWIAACPDEFSFRLIHFSAVEQMDNLGEMEILAEVDRLLGAWADDKRKYIGYHGPNFRAARLLLERELDLERVPGLVEEEIREIQQQWEKQSLEVFPESMRDDIRLSREVIGIENDLLLAEAFLNLGREGKSGRILDECGKRLDEIGQDDDSSAGRLDERRARLWGLRGELAENKDRPLDTFACYRRASRYDPEGGWDDRATEIWHELGGSEEGLATLIDATELPGDASGPIAEVSSWEETEIRLEPFELTDLGGRTWQPADLAGGTSLINIWSTWCGPCRLELPHLQDLNERLDNHEDLRIVSINVDFNPGLVAPFVERLGLTFPVLFGEDYFYDESPTGASGIPQNWIVDPDGIIRWMSTGFPVDSGEQWLAETVELLERAASPPAPMPGVAPLPDEE